MDAELTARHARVREALERDGLDYVMTVRDYVPLAAAADLVPWDLEFDHARAVKSEAEIESVRESVAINVAGFHAFHRAWAPGRTAPSAAR